MNSGRSSLRAAQQAARTLTQGRPIGEHTARFLTSGEIPDDELDPQGNAVHRRKVLRCGTTIVWEQIVPDWHALDPERRALADVLGDYLAHCA